MIRPVRDHGVVEHARRGPRWRSSRQGEPHAGDSVVQDLEAVGDSALDERFGRQGFWSTPPRDCPEAIALRKESRERVTAALAELPDTQRAVVTLRDIEEWASDEVCNVLGLSESNQRVLLHRGRQRLRAVLEAAEAAEGERSLQASVKGRP